MNTFLFYTCYRYIFSKKKRLNRTKWVIWVVKYVSTMSPIEIPSIIVP